MSESDETSQAHQFQNELYSLKEEFYKESMLTPQSLEQELLIAEILRRDLYDIADSLDNYIENSELIIHSTNVISVFKENERKITDDIIKYSRKKQSLINEFMEYASEIMNQYKEIDEFLKKYYVNQIFRIYIFNLE